MPIYSLTYPTVAPQGVTVIGTTSRPELLDPAILRPGRLDRHLFCGYPTNAERCAILAVAVTSVACHPSVDISSLAAASAGLTGADLTGLVAEAQLAAAREAVEQL